MNYTKMLLECQNYKRGTEEHRKFIQMFDSVFMKDKRENDADFIEFHSELKFAKKIMIRTNKELYEMGDYCAIHPDIFTVD